MFFPKKGLQQCPRDRERGWESLKSLQRNGSRKTAVRVSREQSRKVCNRQSLEPERMTTHRAQMGNQGSGKRTWFSQGHTTCQENQGQLLPSYTFPRVTESLRSIWKGGRRHLGLMITMTETQVLNPELQTPPRPVPSVPHHSHPWQRSMW